MRIDELLLERYGAFEHRRLAFDGPGLTVAYGANEAGKSTCLAAIGDFLFRIPERSPRIERFGSDLTRIGATLSAADGRRLVLRRRYGRGRTLIGVDGTPCDDAVVASLLGSTTRDRFENLFGLDHESLRNGGDALLRADGDIGRLIVEAGGGLRTLMSRLDAIDAEIDTLFAPRRKESRAFYKALSEFEAADKAAKGAALTREAYEKDRKAREAAVAATSAARTEKRKLDEALSRLRRAERTIPVIRQFDTLDESLGTFADVLELAQGFAERCAKAFSGQDFSAAELAKARVQHAKLAEKLRAMSVDEVLVALEAEMRDIAQRVAIVEAARGDRANRLKELSDAEAQVALLRERLALPPEADLAPLMPSPPILDAVRELASQADARGPRLETSRDAVHALETEVAEVEKRLADLAARGRDQPFGITAASLAGLPNDWASGERLVAESRAGVQASTSRAAALGFPDVAALRALILPPDDQVRAEVEARNAIETERTRQAAARAAAEVQRDVACAEVERLRQGGEIATADMVAAARKRREQTWAPIRAGHLAGHADGSETERAAEVAALEAGFAEADRLSDSRVLEAERAANLAEAQRRMSEGSAGLKAAVDAQRRLGQALALRTDALRRAFPQAFDLRPELAGLLALSAARAAILASEDTAHGLRAEGERILSRLMPSLRQLEIAEVRAGLPPHAGADLASRVQSVAEAIGRHERDHADHGRESRDLLASRTKLAAARQTLGAIEDQQKAWESAWARAVTTLGLPDDAAPAPAADLAARWMAARGELRSIGQTRRRLRRMDDDERDLAERVATAAKGLGLSLPEDPIVAGAMLGDRWRENDAVRLRKEALAPELEGAKAAVAVHEAAAAQAEATLRALQAEAGVSDDVSLRTAAARHLEATRLRADRARLASEARAAGDGLPLSTLREQAGGQDLDSVRAEIADLTAGLEGLEQAVEAAIRAEQNATGVLLVHEGPSGATLAAVEREAATAEMHAAIERYAELTLARELVTRAVQRVRSEQQDPLVRAAGTMFARMTWGEFDGVAADVDAKGVPVVVGVRPGSRGHQPVSTMSDGTRDQLFLAFRLASLAAYCRAAEPLPFVADDILVHFDDERSAASLDLLAEFATTTQVLLFTHHRSVRTAAEHLAAEGRATIVDLER